MNSLKTLEEPESIDYISLRSHEHYQDISMQDSYFARKKDKSFGKGGGRLHTPPNIITVRVNGCGSRTIRRDSKPKDMSLLEHVMKETGASKKQASQAIRASQ